MKTQSTCARLALFGILFAQSALCVSVGELITKATGVQQLLETTVANAGTEGRSVVGQAVGALDGAINELKSLVNNDLNRQVETLSGTAQTLARTIQGSIDAMDNLVKVRMTCGLEGAEYLVYGVKTIASQLQTALPFVKNATPFLYGFNFDGHFWGVVPKQGGRVTLKGFGLWNGRTGPLVALLDKDGNKIRDLVAGTAGGDDSVAVTLDGQLLQQHAGTCLRVEVIPQKKKTFGGIERLRAMQVPLCVPASLNSQLQIISNITFETKGMGPETLLDERTFRCDNSSCENRGGCNVQQTWVLGEGCQVTRLQTRNGQFMRNNSNVQYSRVGGTVTASGSLDTATCIRGPFGIARLLHTTIFDGLAAPVVSCPATNFVAKQSESKMIPLETAAAPICSRVARPGDTVRSSYAVQLQVLYGPTLRTTILSTPTVTVPPNVASPINQIAAEGLILKGTINPNAGSDAEVCVTVEAPRCGY